MNSANRPGPAEESLETLRDIKRMMERSSRFISLSGLSGVSAGVCALAGAWIAYSLIHAAYGTGGYIAHSGRDAAGTDILKFQLFLLALAVLAGSLISSMWFTWRKARRNGLPIWDHTSKKLMINLAIPMVAGGLFLLGLYYHSQWEVIAPACLVFYGLALVNASKYTLTDIRYLGLLEIALGCVNLYFAQWGIYFWAVGFGALHIVYGLIMWWKYEK
jgi:hypothetical protein